MTKTVKIIIAVIAILAICGGIAGVVAWTQSDKFDQKNLSYIGRYNIGGLDSNGNYSNVNTSIYTEDPFECQGLNCTLDFDATVTYEIYFYNQNNEFVHRSGLQSGAFAEESVPFFVKYARIVITPKDDEKVTQLEKDKYAKQLKIKVNREQGFKNFTMNQLEFNHKGKTLSNSGEIVDNEDTTKGNVSDPVDVRPYKEGLYFRADEHSDWGQGITIAFYNENNGFISKGTILFYVRQKFISSKNITYSQFIISTFPEGTAYIRITYAHSDADIELLCR